MSKIALVSADSHAGLKRGDYFEYMEKKYHDDLSAYVKAKGKEVSLAEERFQRYLAGAEDKKLVEAMVAEKEARERYAVDLASRIEACDQDGFVAEVLFPDASAENEIPFTGLLGGTSGYSAELRSAALRAYNRWLGENCEPERQLGLAVFDTDDPEAALAEIEAARGPGLLGVLPQWDGNDDEALEPVWAACAAEGLAVHFHVGSGLPGNVGENSLATGFRGLIAGGEMVYWCRRPLWHFIWSGILDRYPDLKLVFAESFADWIPRTLGHLDWQWESVRTRGQETVPMRPSEYWARQGYVCAIPLRSRSGSCATRSAWTSSCTGPTSPGPGALGGSRRSSCRPRSATSTSQRPKPGPSWGRTPSASTTSTWPRSGPSSIASGAARRRF